MTSITSGIKISEYLFSEFAETLADGAEIDTGFIDTQTVDKIQFEALASITGLTLVIISSSLPDGAGSTFTTTSTLNSTFNLFNTICRQRYIRYRVQNNTGGDASNVSLSLKASYGSSDKLSVFPLANEPVAFSQAALVQAVQKGQQPDGDYVNQPADGSALSTSTLLTAGQTYTSDWIDSDGWNTIELFVKSDVISEIDGVQIEFTDDAQAATPTVRSTFKTSFEQNDIDRGFLVFRCPPTLDGFRIKYVNGAVNQGSFYLDATLKVFSQNNAYNKGNALITADFNTEVALGNVSNFQIQTTLGRNPDVDMGVAEDVWGGGGNYTGQPTNTTPENFEAFSSSASDAAAGIGARTCRAWYLATTASKDYLTVDFTLNGTTPVNLGVSGYRLVQVEVMSAGSNGTNVGTITVRHVTTTANVFAIMQVGLGKTFIGAYTVPASKKLLIKRYRIGITRANGGAGSATIALRKRNGGNAYVADKTFELSTASNIDFKNVGGDLILAGVDIKFRAENATDNNTVVECAMEYQLIQA